MDRQRLLDALMVVWCLLQIWFAIASLSHSTKGRAGHLVNSLLTARVLDAIMRRTLLPRMGYGEGLTHIQLWLQNALMQQTIFDIWDLILSEMEDTLAEGFRSHGHLSYAHWITFLIHRAVTVRPPEMLAEYSGATIEFPAYNMTQMLRHSAVRTPSQPSHHPEVPESAAQQDETIRGIAAIEEGQLDAQQEGMVKSDPSDSIDDDYQDIPRMPPR